MPMVLVPLDGGRPIPIDKAIMFFGRSPECDIVLDGSRKVSRKHCCVAQIDDHYIVRDLGSMNGIRVNDKQVRSESRLNVGDEFWVGDLGYRFQPLTSAGMPVPSNLAGSPQGAKKKLPPINPDLLSQELPVAIPDQGEDFLVEETRARKRIPQEEVLELDSDDIIS